MDQRQACLRDLSLAEDFDLGLLRKLTAPRTQSSCHSPRQLAAPEKHLRLPAVTVHCNCAGGVAKTGSTAYRVDTWEYLSAVKNWHFDFLLI
jgi:hypothetical protein